MLDNDSLTVAHYAKMFQIALSFYATEKDIEKISNKSIELSKRVQRDSMIKDARECYKIENSMLDTDPYLFNCLNSVVNLKTLEMVPHNPEFFLSKVSNVVYNPNVRSEEAEKFLLDIFCGNQEKCNYVRDILGYALTGINTLEECYFFYGPTTRNGKSTLLDTIGHLMGDYGMNMQPETLAIQKDKSSRVASGDIARLDGCRFLHMAEPPKRMKFDVATLKTLIGRDRITARFLYEREFQFTPVFKLFINTNYLPVVVDNTLFSSGRVKVITFDRHFEKHEQDSNLKERLKTEYNISGIFNWLLEGLQNYINNGYKIPPPESVIKATDEYKYNSDKIMMFMDECTEPDEKICIKGKSLYEVYALWCNENGYGVENKGNFFDELRGKGLLSETAHINNEKCRNVIKGYRLIRDINS